MSSSTQVCIFNPTTGLIDIITGVSAPTGNPADGGKPVVLDSDGNLDVSLIAYSSITVIAEVPLLAGNLVNLHYTTIDSIAGVYARLANASSTYNLPAHAFVTANAGEGDVILAYTGGLANVPFSGGSFSLTDVGAPVYLSTTAGVVTKARPALPNLVQSLGYVCTVGVSPYNFVEIQFVPTPITVLSVSTVTLIDTVTAIPYSLSVINGTLTISSGGIAFTDTVTSDFYVMAVFNGAMTITPGGGGSSSPVVLIDTTASPPTSYTLTIANMAPTLTPGGSDGVTGITLIDTATAASYTLSVENSTLTFTPN
jgi:hypothetical protein